MGSAEKGVCSDWSQVNDPCNPGNADGILQLSPDNEWRLYSQYPYNDTHGGYEGNVRDALSFLNDIANSWEREGIERRFSDIPNGDAVKLLLYYNAGGNPIDMYAYGNQGNPEYLTHVAEHLIDSSFGDFYEDPELAADLIYAQEILDAAIEQHKTDP